MTNFAEKCVTKKEFCEIAGISLSTGYKLIKNNKIKYEKCCDRLLHYYKIPLSEIKKISSCTKPSMDEVDEYESKRELIELYYKNKLKDYPECVSVKDLRNITGYEKERIRRWIISGKIIGTLIKREFRISKDDLYGFLISKDYYFLGKKSNEHRRDIVALDNKTNGGTAK